MLKHTHRSVTHNLFSKNIAPRNALNTVGETIIGDPKIRNDCDAIKMLIFPILFLAIGFCYFYSSNNRFFLILQAIFLVTVTVPYIGYKFKLIKAGIL